MMDKLKSKAGLTLMEMMAALLVMVLLVVGMGTGMDSGMRVYQDAQFESSTATLSSVMQTSLSDLLRYAQVEAGDTPHDFSITNKDFGVLNGKFSLVNGEIKVVNPHDGAKSVVAGIGKNGKDEAKITSFEIDYIGVDPQGRQMKYNPDETDHDAKLVVFTGDVSALGENEFLISRGGFFHIKYTIESGGKAKEGAFVVRQMNAQ